MESYIYMCIYTSAHQCVYPYTRIVQHVRGQCLRSLQHHASSAFQKTKNKKTKKSKRFLLALGTAYQNQARILQQASGRQHISSEAQRSTAKHSQAQRSTEKHQTTHRGSEQNTQHNLTQQSTAEDSTWRDAKIQRSTAHSM